MIPLWKRAPSDERARFVCRMENSGCAAIIRNAFPDAAMIIRPGR